jgi:hypothetical protein
MKRQLIGWALSLAVGLTASGNLALAADGAGGGAANAGTGSSVGSNQGTHVGSNEGTHVGSNEGMNVGSQAPNASRTNNNNTNNNTANNNRNLRPPINSPNLPPSQFQPGFGGFGGGGGGWWGVISGDMGTSYDQNSVGSQGRPINAGQNPANGTTPPSTGQITNNGALTTANVPPPANNNFNGLAMPTANREAQIEGQLVDLLSVSQNVASGESASPTVTSTVQASKASSTGPSNTTGAEAKRATAVPDSGATSSSVGTTGSTASVRTSGSDTFGTYARRGATAAPDSPTKPAGAGSNTAPNASITPPPGSIEGKSLIITDNTPSSGSTSASAAPAPRKFDSTTISRQLTNGMPAAVVSNGHMYILACDPKQLASYAGQDVRVSGRLNSSGALIPDRLEVRQPSGFREITLIKPDVPNASASER